MKQRIGPKAYQTYISTVSRVASASAELGDAVGIKPDKVSNVCLEKAEVILVRLSDHRN